MIQINRFNAKAVATHLRRQDAGKISSAILSGASVFFAMACNIASAAPTISVQFIPFTNNPQGASFMASISADGRYLAYKYMSSTNGGLGDIHVLDRETGVTIQANQKLDGTVSTGGKCDVPKITSDGRYVVFSCPSSEIGVLKPGQGYFVYDRINRKTEVVAVSSVTESIDGRANAGISPDGRYVAYRIRTGTVSTLMLRDRINNTTQATSAHSSHVGLIPAPMTVSVGGRYIAYQGREEELAELVVRGDLIA